MTALSGSEIFFTKSPQDETDALVLFYNAEKTPAFDHEHIGDAMGFLDHVVSHHKSFSGKKGQVELLTAPQHVKAQYIVLVGCGEAGEFDHKAAEAAGGKIFVALQGKNLSQIDVIAGTAHGDLAAHVALGMRMRSYRFDLYKAKKADDETVHLRKVSVVTPNQLAVKSVFEKENAAIDGMFTARNLVNEPPNKLYPEAYADRIKDLLKPLGVKVEIMDEKKLKKLGMGALMAVAQGSDNVPRVVVMQWIGDKDARDLAPLAFVGKGVTFDTGGISLKPGAGMEDMKMDMGGSAAVVGLLQSLATRKAKTNVVGIVGLVENMPSARAYRPADIVTSYSGKTIEVLNTDAEGRLVLADVLSYVQDVYKPRMIVDLATLTGAIIVALGHEYAGAFVSDDTMWAQLENAGGRSNEALWRMPLDKAFKDDMEGTISDIQNMSKSGRGGGSCTAAGFLSYFIENDTPWAHLDIAGTAWTKADKDTVPKYGTGFGVRLLDRFICDHHEG